MGNSAKEEFALLLTKGIKSALPTVSVDDNDIYYSITYSKNTEWDISSSIALRLAKLAGSAPAAIAESIAKNMRNGKFTCEISQLNGYINAKIDEKELAKHVISDVTNSKEKYGSSKVGNGKKAIIEYPSVNPNKPWHIGHLRNPLLGDSISRLMSFCSYDVKRIDYIDDLGLQMAEILWGSRNLPWDSKGRKYDQYLGEQYVEVNKHLKEPGVEVEIKEILGKMEVYGSSEASEVREIAEKCVRAQYETAFAYGIYHDAMVWESDILHEKLLSSAIELLKKQGIARSQKGGKYDGCLVISKKGPEAAEESDSKVLIRSNGAATYLAKDIAFHMWKLGIISVDFKYAKFIRQPDGKFVYSTSSSGESMSFAGADIAINPIGSAQKMQQDMLREVLSAVSGKADALHHLSYGEISLAEGKISGRSGTWLGDSRNYTADDLLKEVRAKALEIIKNSEKVNKETDPDTVAEKVAISAIKFDFLRIDPLRKAVFDWNRALDFNSNSGPYCMYMYARASRILEKSSAASKDIMLTDADCSNMSRSHDFEMVKLISQCSDMVEKACREYKPNIIAEYVMELSFTFGSFYQGIDVLKSGKAVNLRLAIVWAARQTIYNMLYLLSIETICQ